MRQIAQEDVCVLHRSARFVAINSALTILTELPPCNPTASLMKRHDLKDEQKKLAWRYVEVWRRFRRLPDGYRSSAELEDDLAQGSGMSLCGLLVDAEASTVISADVKDPKFHAAIFGTDKTAAPDMTADELQQARRYIIEGEGSAPVRWWSGKPPLPSLVGGTDTVSRPASHPPKSTSIAPVPRSTE